MQASLCVKGVMTLIGFMSFFVPMMSFKENLIPFLFVRHGGAFGPSQKLGKSLKTGGKFHSEEKMKH